MMCDGAIGPRELSGVCKGQRDSLTKGHVEVKELDAGADGVRIHEL